MEQNDETEFFPENSVSFSHNSVACAVRTLQFVLFKQALSVTMHSDGWGPQTSISTTAEAMNVSKI